MFATAAMPQLSHWTIAALISVLGALFAIWRDRRNMRRKNLDSVSLVPWQLLSVILMLVSLVAILFAIKMHYSG